MNSPTIDLLTTLRTDTSLELPLYKLPPDEIAQHFVNLISKTLEQKKQAKLLDVKVSLCEIRDSLQSLAYHLPDYNSDAVSVLTEIFNRIGYLVGRHPLSYDELVEELAAVDECIRGLLKLDG